MSKQLLSFVFVLVCGVVFALPSHALAKVSEFAEPIMYKSIRAGEVFSVKLDANVTTGHSWRLAKPLDESKVKLVAQEYIARPTPPLVAGVGGEDVWTFDAISKGTTEIHLELVRPWEKNAVPVKKVNIKLRIE